MPIAPAPAPTRPPRGIAHPVKAHALIRRLLILILRGVMIPTPIRRNRSFVLHVRPTNKPVLFRDRLQALLLLLELLRLRRRLRWRRSYRIGVRRLLVKPEVREVRAWAIRKHLRGDDRRCIIPRRIGIRWSRQPRRHDRRRRLTRRTPQRARYFWRRIARSIEGW